MKILVTGAAGFIGGAFCLRLLEDGHDVIGLDNLSDYYAVALKHKRLAQLQAYPKFQFYRRDLSQPGAMLDLPEGDAVERVVHLAAQAGVRYSMENPYPYIMSNVVGHLSALEFCRHHPRAPLLIYASSSSVYGQGALSPFCETAPRGAPASLYAVTKETDELMSRTYAALYGLKQIGLRFFTVYGPWGRPDMAYWMFAKSMLEGRAIDVFNHGEMARDFTYIDDVVSGLMAVTFDLPDWPEDAPPHKMFNLGTGKAQSLAALIKAVSKATGKAPLINHMPMQPGDVAHTCADIGAIAQAYNYKPGIMLDEGISNFVDWFQSDADYKTY